MQIAYNREKFTTVNVYGIECDFSDMRIDRSTVPKGRYQYEVANDDESQGDPTRVKKGIMVNFWGTLISDVPLPLGSDGVLWLDDGEFLYL
ncbi:MAG: hypothetical protein K2P48_03635 [Lachnospiraceae bacterium]|nr:hypothetical protein [Lachnospiraceae bacterium]